jgi:hypothetical protein
VVVLLLVALPFTMKEFRFFLALVNMRKTSLASGEPAATMGTDKDNIHRILAGKKHFLLFIFFSCNKKTRF